MLIFFDLAVRLGIHPACSHKNPELPVPQSGYQARHVTDTHRHWRGVTLRFEGKIDEDGSRPGADPQLANSIAASIARWTGDIKACNLREHDSRKRSSIMFEAMWISCKVSPHNLHYCQAFSVIWKLFLPRAVLKRPRCNERPPLAAANPRPPSGRRQFWPRWAVDDAVDPTPLNNCSIKDREPRAVILKTAPAGRSPYGNEILGKRQVGCAWHCETQKHYVSPASCTCEDKYGGYTEPALFPAVCVVKEAAQEFVAETPRVVKRSAGFLVVSIVRKNAGFTVKRVRPVRINA
jgi:hypothetical protein